VPNACGSIAVIHTIANLRERLSVEKDSPIDKFLANTIDKTPEERGRMLGLDEAIAGAHKQVAKKGQTNPDGDYYRSDFHFVVFLNYSRTLIELDGTKAGPINHGTTSETSFVRDTAGIVRRIMSECVLPICKQLLSRFQQSLRTLLLRYHPGACTWRRGCRSREGGEASI